MNLRLTFRHEYFEQYITLNNFKLSIVCYFLVHKQGIVERTMPLQQNFRVFIWSPVFLNQ